MSTTVPMMSGAQVGSMSKRISCHDGLLKPFVVFSFFRSPHPTWRNFRMGRLAGEKAGTAVKSHISRQQPRRYMPYSGTSRSCDRFATQPDDRGIAGGAGLV